jgi:hypothetical protein
LVKEEENSLSYEVILQCEDGAYYFKDHLQRDPKHRVETAFRKWVEENGEDGKNYIAAKLLTEPVTVKVETVKTLVGATDKKQLKAASN